MTAGTWYPTPERPRQGGHPKPLALLPKTPIPNKTPKYLHPQGQDGQMVLVRGSCSAQSHLRRGLDIKNYLSIRGRGRGAGGQALGRGTKCLDPAKFKGTLPPAPRRDVAGRRMAGGHTAGKVCNNPFITLQILVLLAFAAAIFLLGNW